MCSVWSLVMGVREDAPFELNRVSATGFPVNFVVGKSPVPAVAPPSAVAPAGSSSSHSGGNSSRPPSVGPETPGSGASAEGSPPTSVPGSAGAKGRRKVPLTIATSSSGALSRRASDAESVDGGACPS